MIVKFNMVNLDTNNIHSVEHCKDQTYKVNYKTPVVLGGKTYDYQMLVISPFSKSILQNSGVRFL